MTPDDSDNVVEITIAGTFRQRKTAKACLHRRIELDAELLDILCLDCGSRVNPIVWMIGREKRFEQHVKACEEYQIALACYHRKMHCKCQHCGRITSVREPTTAEIEMERRARIANGDLLEVKR